MELCLNRAVSNAPHSPNCRLPTSVNRRLRLPLHLKQTPLPLRCNSDAYCKRLSTRAIMSEDTPSEMNKFDGETSRSKFDGETSSRISVVEDVQPADKNSFSNSVEEEIRQEDSPLDEQTQPFGELLDKFDLKLDTEDSYYIFLYGGGALLSVWLLSAVVGAIDSIPVFPKLLEVVGLSYSLWFTTRYLIFKENRDELAAKIEELKKQVLGSDEN